MPEKGAAGPLPAGNAVGLLLFSFLHWVIGLMVLNLGFEKSFQF